MTKLASLIASTSLCAGAWLVGCTPSGSGSDEADSTATSETMSESSGSDTGESTTSETTTTFSTATMSETAFEDNDTLPPAALGEDCKYDSDCMRGLYCNGVPQLGAAVCSECDYDGHCNGGNCTFTANGYFQCGDGSLGQGCESNAVCADGLYCAELVASNGFFSIHTCSECNADNQCMNGQLCAPTIEFVSLLDIRGQRSCIDPNTHPDDATCDADGNGDEQCEGFCTPQNLGDFVQTGVCGECEVGADCPDGLLCNPAVVGFDGVMGSYCG